MMIAESTSPKVGYIWCQLFFQERSSFSNEDTQLNIVQNYQKTALEADDAIIHFVKLVDAQKSLPVGYTYVEGC